MIAKYICSAVLLVFLSTNVMQGEASYGSEYYNGFYPYGNHYPYGNYYSSYLPSVGEYSNNAASASAAASAAANGGIRDYYRSGFVPSRYRLLSGLGNVVAPYIYGSGLAGRLPYANYGVYGSGLGNAATTAAASAAASTTANNAVVPGYQGYGYGYPGYGVYGRNYGVGGIGDTASAAAAAAATAAATGEVAKR